MITHIPALTHPQPRKVLIIGGGEGGTVRELLRYSSIEAIELVEIDDKVVEAAKLFFPEMAGGLDHPKVTVFFQDGIEFVKQHKNKYDLALIDSIDPVGPAEGLFEKPFFENVHRCLKEDGIMCAQAESTLYGAEISRSMMVKLKTLYPIVLPYYSFIPTYPSGQWLFVLASKKYHPLVDFRSEDAESLQRKLKYYNSSIHQSSFALPSCLARFYEP
jgi:spermidine synthase